MKFICLSISILILLLVSINALNVDPIEQEVLEQCSFLNMCEYMECGAGKCIDDKTTLLCFRCECPPGFLGLSCQISGELVSNCTPPCEDGQKCLLVDDGISVCIYTGEDADAQRQTSVSLDACTATSTPVCKNGGSCLVDGTSYVCSCPTGWSGPTCEIQNSSTPCTPNPCLHGTCLQAMLPNYQLVTICDCDPQWSGDLCDTSLTGNCLTNYCQSGGTCQMNGNISFCICPPTHTGQQCETLLTTSTITTSTITTDTITTPSVTTATITFTTTSSTGSTSSQCTSTSCLNGGTCYQITSGFICLCPPQYTGPSCSQTISSTTTVSTTSSSMNFCSPNPCNNGGTCYKYNGGFVCLCTTLYTGLTCDTVKTTVAPTTPSASITCANQPCQNGASCYNAGNSYFCYCGANNSFTGKNCETPITAPDTTCPLNCSPGGYCLRSGSNPDTYACMCGNTLKPTSCSEN